MFVEEEHKAGVTEALEALSTYGFYAIERTRDPVAEIISKNHVGGLVQRGSLVVGLNPKFWDSTDHNFALVPSSQFMRLASDC